MLKKLFGKKKKPEAEGLESLSPAIREAILQAVGGRSIPSMPGAAQKAFELATDPNAEARDFVEVIKADESLSARIIKISNSVFFDRGHGGSKTIEDAVMVIGISELRGLLNAGALSDLFPSRHPARTQLWANDIATGIAARLLAQRLLPGKEDNAFLAGLMHDVGKLLLLQRVQDEYLKVLALVRGGKSFCEAEEETFIFNHTEVGQLIGERWNFSAELIAAIRGHHRVPTAGPATLSKIIHVADLAAHSLGLGHPAGFGQVQSKAEENLRESWTLVGLPNDDLKPFLQGLQRTFSAEYELYARSGS